LRLGFWSLFGFAAAGLALETFHGFKAPFYLDVANDSRRLVWTLAHAHGVLLGGLNVLYAVAVRSMPELGVANRALISRSLTASTLLLPGGFFLGGFSFYAGDPGLGVLLVPAGAALLLVALALLARSAATVRLDGPKPEA
jgi:hypothetical protein